MLSLAEVGEESLAAWKADVDLGDHVVRARRGHHAPAAASCRVLADAWQLAAKALRPLPVLHKDAVARRPASGSATST